MLLKGKLLSPNICNEVYIFQSKRKLYSKKFCLAVEDISDRCRMYHECRK